MLENRKLYEEQPQVLKELSNMVKKGHVPHALIFYGEKSTSKKEVAKEFSKMLYEDYFNTNIENYELGSLIDKESHPNIKHIKKDSKSSITIDYAREIISDSEMYSEYSGPSIYIFEDADYFNSSSINSILKFTEEPKENTYIIFLVDNLSNLLPTIISRSILINFKPLDKKNVVANLVNLGLDKAYLNVLAEYRQNEDVVKELYEKESYLSIYNSSIDLINEPFENSGSLVLGVNEVIKTLKDSDEIEFYISLLVFIVEDLLKIKRNNQDLVFYNNLDRLTKVSSFFSEDKLIETVKKLLELKSHVSLKRQVNTVLFLNTIFLDLELSSTEKR